MTRSVTFLFYLSKCIKANLAGINCNKLKTNRGNGSGI